MKKIAGFEDYSINTEGVVVSYKYKKPRIIKTYIGAGGYEYIRLCKDGKVYHKTIHRLVAENFIDNPNNLEEVGHIIPVSKGGKNNMENLKWISRKDNLKESYETMPPTRNFFNCVLYKEDNNEEIGKFDSISSAAAYARDNFGCSYSGMVRNYKSKGYYLDKI